jgi:hypothetical protein
MLPLSVFTALAESALENDYITFTDESLEAQTNSWVTPTVNPFFRTFTAKSADGTSEQTIHVTGDRKDLTDIRVLDRPHAFPAPAPPAVTATGDQEFVTGHLLDLAWSLEKGKMPSKPFAEEGDTIDVYYMPAYMDGQFPTVDDQARRRQEPSSISDARLTLDQRAERLYASFSSACIGSFYGRKDIPPTQFVVSTGCSEHFTPHWDTLLPSEAISPVAFYHDDGSVSWSIEKDFCKLGTDTPTYLPDVYHVPAPPQGALSFSRLTSGPGTGIALSKFVPVMFVNIGGTVFQLDSFQLDTSAPLNAEVAADIKAACVWTD